MFKVVHSAALSACMLLSLGAFCGPAPAEARSTIKKSDLRFDLTSLAPEVRASLKKIDVLLLTDDNYHAVWKLAKKPRRADVVVVACSPACLSTDVLEALADWSKGGGGLFLEASAAFQASAFLLPEGYFIEPANLGYARGQAWLENGGPLTSNIRQVRKELWCSRDGTGRLRLRSDAEDERSLERVLFELGETFLPVLSWSPAPRPGKPVTAVFDTPASEEDGAGAPEDDPADALEDGQPAAPGEGLPRAEDETLPVLDNRAHRHQRRSIE